MVMVRTVYIRRFYGAMLTHGWSEEKRHPIINSLNGGRFAVCLCEKVIYRERQ